MPTSVKEFFDTKVPSALLKHPDKAKDVAAVYLFNISGPDGGIWTADLNAVPPTCLAGASGNPQCTIEASDDDFRAMIDGGMPVAMQLFFSGKIKVSGDANLAPRLSKILQMGAI
jgi:hypothetical protein